MCGPAGRTALWTFKKASDSFLAMSGETHPLLGVVWSAQFDKSARIDSPGRQARAKPRESVDIRFALLLTPG
jgi:hypothetical protein